MNKRTSSFQPPTRRSPSSSGTSSTRSPSPTCAMNSTSTPTSFYGWHKEFFENGHTAFDNGRKRQGRRGCQGREDPEARSQAHTQERGHGRAHGSPHRVKKKILGNSERAAGSPTTRATNSSISSAPGRDKTDIAVARFMPWIGIGRSKYQDWVTRFGKVNEHNAWVPRDHWLTEDEIMRICNFARQHPLRRLSPHDLHDARCRCRRLQPGQRLSRPQKSRTPGRARRPTSPRKAPASCSPCKPTRSGTSMSATSTSPAPFTSCAPSSTATAASSSTGKSAKKWRKPTWKPSSSAPVKSSPASTHASSATTVRSSSPRTSRSSSASPA